MELFWLRAKNTQFADRHLNWDLHFNCTSWSSFARQQLLFLLFSLHKVLMHKSQPATDWHMYYEANSHKTNIDNFWFLRCWWKYLYSIQQIGHVWFCSDFASALKQFGFPRLVFAYFYASLTVFLALYYIYAFIFYK